MRIFKGRVQLWFALLLFILHLIAADERSLAPMTAPTAVPSPFPTTEYPTAEPSLTPMTVPTAVPSPFPTTEYPTAEPSLTPTTVPSTVVPSPFPTTEYPTAEPSLTPTTVPSADPTALPPSLEPTSPSITPTVAPSGPSPIPSIAPSYTPTTTPTSAAIIPKDPSQKIENDGLYIVYLIGLVVVIVGTFYFFIRNYGDQFGFSYTPVNTFGDDEEDEHQQRSLVQSHRDIELARFQRMAESMRSYPPPTGSPRDNRR